MTFKKRYAEYYDLFNNGKDYTKECDFLEEVFRKYLKVPVKSILDLGCGTGMHDKELISRGYNVTGIDLSQEMIEIAKQRVPKAKFRVGDMANFELDEKFDVILTMFAAIGYLTKNKQLEDFFNNVKKYLKEDGMLIIDCWNGLGVLRELPSIREKSAEVEGLKITRKSFPELDAKNHINNVKFKVKVFKEEKLIDEYYENHKVRFFFPKELEKYATKNFELIKLCPSYELNEELTENNWNMVLVFKKK